jgi:hypothetical protein
MPGFALKVFGVVLQLRPTGVLKRCADGRIRVPRYTLAEETIDHLIIEMIKGQGGVKVAENYKIKI